MARFGFFFLIFVGILVLQAMADDKSEAQNGVKPKGGGGGGRPALSPLQAEKESGEAEAPGIRKLGKHHSSDKSVAGGGVILGGLVTAIFAAVFCYIRVTRKRNGHQGGH
ncbi:hypothetical protein DKX38_029911 [Salix brachista]|uniref:Transmembrane protein n=1 Tax=Salix brachista TaxID=2182728 RepID=A0A5N5J5Z0_9ROSI|nr:hypothetical protein DKX38_029911 [Salix brachista]